MTASNSTYQDVSNDPAAAEKAVYSITVRASLLSMGFTTVGLIKENASHDIPDVRQHFLRQPNGEAMLQLLKDGPITEIFASPEQHAFAWIEPFFTVIVLCFVTIFDNGAVIETTSYLNFSAKNPPPKWPRPARPLALYHQSLFTASDVQQTWAHHTATIANFSQRTGYTLSPHNSLLLALAIQVRIADIQQHQIRWQRIYIYGTALVAFVCVVAFGQYIVFPLLSTIVPSMSSTIRWLLVPLPYFAASVAIILFLLTQMMRNALFQYLPGPQAEPVDQLLQRVSFM